jgi:hypothetical protein
MKGAPMLSLFAQVVTPAVPVAPTPLGSLLVAAYTLAALALVAGLAMGVKWLNERAQANKTLLFLAKLSEIAQSIVAHVEAEIRPTMGSVLADGKLSPVERLTVKAEAMRRFRDALADDGLKDLEGLLGLSGDGPVATFLSGLIERALGIQRAAGTLPPPAPVATTGMTISSLTSATPLPSRP